MALSNASRPNLADLFLPSWGPGLPKKNERPQIAKRKSEKHEPSTITDRNPWRQKLFSDRLYGFELVRTGA